MPRISSPASPVFPEGLSPRCRLEFRPLRPPLRRGLEPGTRSFHMLSSRAPASPGRYGAGVVARYLVDAPSTPPDRGALAPRSTAGRRAARRRADDHPASHVCPRRSIGWPLSGPSIDAVAAPGVRGWVGPVDRGAADVCWFPKFDRRTALPAEGAAAHSQLRGPRGIPSSPGRRKGGGARRTLRQLPPSYVASPRCSSPCSADVPAFVSMATPAAARRGRRSPPAARRSPRNGRRALDPCSSPTRPNPSCCGLDARYSVRSTIRVTLLPYGRRGFGVPAPPHHGGPDIL